MEEKHKKLDKLLKIFLFIIILIFTSLSVRLFYLQVINQEEFKTKSEKNRIRLLEIEAKRGEILDRNKQVLATSKPVFVVTLSHLDNKEEQGKVIEKLAEILNMPDLTAEDIWEKVKGHARKYEPVEIVKLPWGQESVELISRIEENRMDLPGVNIEEKPMRYYPNGPLAGHLLGYIGQIDQQELERYGLELYGINDKIGKIGLERVYELVIQDGEEIGLRGKKGAQQVEVNNLGQVVNQRPLTIHPVPGNTLELTIDAKLQKVMEKTMDEVIAEVKQKFPKAGAGGAVLIDVKTGAILAMASKPDINPNDFVDGSFGEKADYYNDKNILPAYNRVIQAAYPPGSTFKMITGLAALASGKVSPQETVVCAGSYWKPPYIKCWSVHGQVDLEKALAVSCNTYFQYAAEKAGIDWLYQVGKEFGLGEKTGLKDLLGESSGVLPSPERKVKLNEGWVEEKHQENVAKIEEKYAELISKVETEREKKQLEREKKQALRYEESRYKSEYNFYVRWQPYETYNTSIGQGDNNYTVLQLANYVATLANGGKRYQPYLVSKIISPEGKILQQFEPKLVQQVSLEPQVLKEVQKGMLAVTQPGGTAYRLFSDFPEHIKVAAKTGTAQTGRVGDDKNREFHGVFVAYAPYDNPQIAFAGLIEYGESGSGSIGKVAKAVFEEYFGIKSHTDAEEDNTLSSPLEESMTIDFFFTE